MSEKTITNTALIQQSAAAKPAKTEPTLVTMIKARQADIAKALPANITPERFTRVVLNAVNTTKDLMNCDPMSFLGAMMSSAQLGLEPNTPLGQAYLIPYKGKATFQLGYKGLLDLATEPEPTSPRRRSTKTMSSSMSSVCTRTSNTNLQKETEEIR